MDQEAVIPLVDRIDCIDVGRKKYGGLAPVETIVIDHLEKKPTEN